MESCAMPVYCNNDPSTLGRMHQELDSSLFQKISYTQDSITMRTFPICGDIPGQHHCPAHWHNEFEIVLVDQGCMEYTVNGKIYEITDGMALLLKPDVLHGTLNKVPTQAKIFLINLNSVNMPDSYLYKYLNELFAHGDDLWLLDQSEGWHMEYLNELRKLYSEYRSQNPGFELSCISILFRMFHLLYLNSTSMYRGNSAPRDQHLIEYLKQMLFFIQGHYSEKIRVEDIAAAANISKSSCDKIFRKILNCSPIDYLKDYRLQQSMEYLRSGSTVTEAALSCGFNNLAYYSRVFKQKTGQTPIAFRNS